MRFPYCLIYIIRWISMFLTPKDPYCNCAILTVCKFTFAFMEILIAFRRYCEVSEINRKKIEFNQSININCISMCALVTHFDAHTHGENVTITYRSQKKWASNIFVVCEINRNILLSLFVWNGFFFLCSLKCAYTWNAFNCVCECCCYL